MKIAYVGEHDARDVHSWSGTPYFICRALAAQGCSVCYVGPLRERFSLFFKAQQMLYRRVLGRNHLRFTEPIILRHYADQASAELAQAKIDVILCTATIPVAHLATDVPIVLWTDSTFGGMLDFYPSFSGLSARAIRNGDRMERAVLGRCRLAIFSSSWGAQTATDLYSADSEKIKVVPYGANLSVAPSASEIETLISSRSSTTCQLLFLGVDWERKGGRVAYETAKLLNERGFATDLTVIGCYPVLGEHTRLPRFVHVVGPISKARAKGRTIIANHLEKAHFLILPSVADCTPIVICEASAFGVPCLASDVGGIPTIVRSGENGAVFPVGAEPTQYADYIQAVVSGGQYQALARLAHAEYERRLNWKVATHTVLNLIERVV